MTTHRVYFYQEVIDDLMTVSDAAHFKGVNESSIRKAIRANRLTGWKVGPLHLVSRQEVEGLVIVGHRPRKSL